MAPSDPSPPLKPWLHPDLLTLVAGGVITFSLFAMAGTGVWVEAEWLTMAALVLVAHGALASRFAIALGTWWLAIVLSYGWAARSCLDGPPCDAEVLLAPGLITASLALAGLAVGRALRWLAPSLAAAIGLKARRG